jgi:hypothetical protein
MFVRRKVVKGRVYLCEVNAERDGNKVRQKIIRWIGRAPES